MVTLAKPSSDQEKVLSDDFFFHQYQGQLHTSLLLPPSSPISGGSGSLLQKPLWLLLLCWTVLPADSTVIQVSYEGQVLQPRGFLKLSKEGLMSFILNR